LFNSATIAACIFNPANFKPGHLGARTIAKYGCQGVINSVKFWLSTRKFSLFAFDVV